MQQGDQSFLPTFWKHIFLGVFEPTKIKTKSLKLAAEAATTILRIDDQINLYPTEKKEKSYSDALAAGELDGWNHKRHYINLG